MYIPMFTLWLAQCPVNCTVLSVIVWVSVACSCLVQWTTPGEHWPREASYSVWASVACNCLVHWHTPDNHWPRKVSYSVWASVACSTGLHQAGHWCHKPSSAYSKMGHMVVAYGCLLHCTQPGWPLMPQAKLSLQQDRSHDHSHMVRGINTQSASSHSQFRSNCPSGHC